MKKILFLAANYPPYMTDGASRAFRMASRLPGYGWEPVVVAPPLFNRTGGETARPEPLKEPDPIRVYRSGEAVALGDVDECTLAAFARGERIVQGGLLSGMLPSIFREVHPCAVWEKQAEVVAQKVMKEHPDIEAIYAQGPPSAPIRLGMELSLRHGVPVMFDLTAPLDAPRPWSPLGDLRSDELFKLEQKVLCSGYGVITPTRALKEHFLKRHFGKVAHDDITIITDCGPVVPTAAPPSISAHGRPLFIIERADEKGAKVFFQALATVMRECPGGSAFSGSTIVDASGGMVPKLLRKVGLEGDLALCCTFSEDQELELCRSASTVGVVSGSYEENELWLPDRLIDAALIGRPVFAVAPAGVATRFTENAGGFQASPDNPVALRDMLCSLSCAVDGGVPPAPSVELIARHSESEVLSEMVKAIALLLPL
ncbi:MAG: hypothetical protein A3K90_01060 [Pelodictyon luteolum]|uniref:Glycosyltransferase subfamily 4-like N-terminal domain-containing protein n=1 Tax=Pelodictyon luteolum TaxID=1100 RepID=A0A165L9I2_PELLU|nr:hypothetical protein [Pelodictyon luteolum]KZK73744.1 MAG: hypothetical protein A3K90_01060 [Pelodictyon luteolum]